MIRGIIFDLGNTLMYWDVEGRDIDKIANEALVKFLNQNGVSVKEDFIPLFRAAREDGWRLAEQSNIEHTVDEALTTALSQQGYTCQDGLLARAVEHFFEVGAAYRKAYPESIQALHDLKAQNLKVGLVSNADDDGLVQRCVVQLGLSPYLDPVTSSAGLKWRKPNPNIFKYVADIWHLPTSQIAMVGDAPRYDIIGAHNVGMRGILVDRGEGHWWQKVPDELAQDPAAKPDAIVGSLLEIPGVIAQW